MTWLRQLVAGLSPRRPRPVIGFMVDKMALGQDFVTVLQFTPVSIMPPLLHTHRLIDGQCSVTVKTGSIIK